MSASGSKDGGDGGTPSSVADDFLKQVAEAPQRTVPSGAAKASEPVILAHFRVLELLGQGGMGIVYRAHDEKLGRVVALKVLPPEFEADHDKRQRFLREARVAAAVTHPNLTSIYEIGESGGRIFIAMEMVEGRSLRVLMDGRPLPLAKVIQVSTQTAAGLAKAHAAGIVHRDLKPENLLVSDEGHVKILDFGIAKRPGTEGLLETGTGEGVLLGTPAYMPLEQALGQRVTAATDVFALGVLMFEMLTAQRPFVGKNVPQVIRSLERDTPAAPSSLNPLVPDAFDGVIARCLAKQPTDRFADAQSVLEELRKLEVVLSRLSLASTARRPVVPGDATSSPRGPKPAVSALDDTRTERTAPDPSAQPAPSLRLPCDPGMSRFHIKGLAYRGLKQFIRAQLPGGMAAVVSSVEDERLHPFLEQQFLAASRYDILPMLPLNAAIARILGKPLQEHAAQQGAAQARHDAEEVYRRSFDAMTLADPVGSMNRFEMLYYDFGDCDGEVLEPGHVRQSRRGLPKYLLPWFAPMHAAYAEQLFRMKGGNDVRAVTRPPTPAGTRHGLKVVDLDTDIYWR